MRRCTFITLIVLCGCSSEKMPTLPATATPTVTNSTQPFIEMFKITDADKFFLEQDRREDWNKKYVGKRVQAKAFFLALHGDQMSFTVKGNLMRSGPMKLQDLRNNAQSAAFAKMYILTVDEKSYKKLEVNDEAILIFEPTVNPGNPSGIYGKLLEIRQPSSP